MFINKERKKMENKRTREQILAEALESREQEIMHYQINIDNYTLALDEISKMSLEEKADISDFADNIRNLLVSEKKEQKKAKLMYEVIKRQVNA
jgi:chromosome segregation ATPase